MLDILGIKQQENENSPKTFKTKIKNVLSSTFWPNCAYCDMCLAF